MGDRISISFKTTDGSSIALFSHWRGKGMLNLAQMYVEELHKRAAPEKAGIMSPLDRLESNTVMLDFIAWLVETEKVSPPVRSDLYLGVDAGDGDNSDNGHFDICVYKTEEQKVFGFEIEQ